MSRYLLSRNNSWGPELSQVLRLAGGLAVKGWILRLLLLNNISQHRLQGYHTPESRPKRALMSHVRHHLEKSRPVEGLHRVRPDRGPRVLTLRCRRLRRPRKDPRLVTERVRVLGHLQHTKGQWCPCPPLTWAGRRSGSRFVGASRRSQLRCQLRNCSTSRRLGTSFLDHLRGR